MWTGRSTASCGRRKETLPKRGCGQKSVNKCPQNLAAASTLIINQTLAAAIAIAIATAFALATHLAATFAALLSITGATLSREPPTGPTRSACDYKK